MKQFLPTPLDENIAHTEQLIKATEKLISVGEAEQNEHWNSLFALKEKLAGLYKDRSRQAFTGRRITQ